MSDSSSSIFDGAGKKKRSFCSRTTEDFGDAATSERSNYDLYWEVEAPSPTVGAEDEQPSGTLNRRQYRRLYDVVGMPRFKEGIGSTARDWSDKEISKKLEDIVSNAAEDIFEPGFQSALETQLMPKLVMFGNRAVSIIGNLIKRREFSVEARAECVRILGRTYYGLAKQEILLVLIEALNSDEPIIRESAGLALGDTEDAAAIDFLEERSRIEKFSSLRHDFEQIAEDLTAAHRA